MTNYKYIIVGAGLWGSVLAERIASQLSEKVLVIDKRDHIGGNCHSDLDEETGIECHTYGTHIFHTKIERVWDYINKFASFSEYRHRVWTTYKNRVYPMPISLATINSFFGLNLMPYEVDDFIKKESQRENIKKANNLEDKAISLIGRPLYEAFIKGYTEKQWGQDPRNLPQDIITRLPVRTNYCTDYFDDPWQGLPLKGYLSLFEKMLENPLIDLRLKLSYQEIKDQTPENTKVFYSGPIDELFDFSLGRLEWRSLRFEKNILPYEDAQGTSVMNQADLEVSYTRTHEYKHLHPERGKQGDKSVLVYEYPVDFKPGDTPYYPVNTAENQALADKYFAIAKTMKNLEVGGRLGGYRYLDMDKTIERALISFGKLKESLN